MSKRSDRRREMTEVLALREQEGLSLRQLAEQFDIPVGTLSWWSHRLRAEKAEKREAFTEVRVSKTESVARSGGAAPLRLRCPGGVVAEFEGELANQIADALVSELDRWS
jgi:transcriptional regulator with XRE-family HTH domain